MTINLADNTPRVSYAVAEGVTQTSFTVSFEFFDDADLNVYVDSVLKTLTTDYTVSGGDGSTGTVTISVTGAAGGSTIVITRDIDLKRTTDFPASGAFQVGSLNTELDKLVAIAADLDDKASRALQLTDYDSAVSLVLPDVDTRKGTVLAFDSSTGAVTAGPPSDNVNTLADVADDIATLADIEDGTDATDAIQTVAGISANVTTVAGVSSDVTTVAGQTTNMQNITDNLTDIQNAATNATNAAASATAAAASESAAATSETNAATSATNSATSATSSATSATASAASATAAAASESAAATSEANAATSASNASTSETNSAASASSASTSAANSATSETNAATSASNASTSETNAASSATAAASSAAAAASAFDNFDDTYLGAKASDPTLDNDGDPLTTGDLYFNTTENEMRVYDGAQWIAASAATQASLILYEYTATSGQTTFSGADDNAATLSYTADNLQVVMNGIVLDPSDFTATNGTSVVLASGAAANDLVNIYAFQSFTVADTVSASAGGTFSANVTITGDLTVDTNTLYVDSTNNEVGIGTLTPGGSLEVYKAGTSEVLIGTDNGGTAQLSLYESDDGTKEGLLKYDGTNNRIHLATSGAPNALVIPRDSGNLLHQRTSNTISGTSVNKMTLGDGTGQYGVIVDVGSGSGYYGFARGGTYNSRIRYDYTSNFMALDVNGAERMRIDSDGHVHIANTSHVINVNEIFSITGKTGMEHSGSAPLHIMRLSDSGVAVNFGNQGIDGVGNISVGTSSTSYNTSSDHRLKENVADMTGAIDRVKQLAPKRFNFIIDPDDTTVDGFLAHEAQTVVPEAVTGTHNEVDDDGNAVMQGIDQSKLVPLLTGALQEAIAKIETLEAKVTALENAS